MKSLEKTISESIKNSVECVLRPIIEKISLQDAKLSELSDKIDSQGRQISFLTKELLAEKTKTTLAFDVNEQFSRRSNLRINGLILEEGETTDTAIIRLAGKLGSNTSKSDISRSHKIGRANGIIVKFVSYNARIDFLTKRKVCREDPNLRDVFISEDLTKRRYDILRSLLKIKKDNKLHSVWSFDGQIKCKLMADSRPIVINNIADVFG